MPGGDFLLDSQPGCRQRASQVSRLAKLSSVVLSALLLAGPSVCLCAASETPKVEAAKTESCCHPAPDTARPSHTHNSKDCPHCNARVSGTLDTHRTDAAQARTLAFVPLPAVPSSVVPASSVAVTCARALGPPPLLPLTLERLHVSLLL